MQKIVNPPILIIDDEQDSLETYRLMFRFNGIENFILMQDSRKVIAFLEENTVSLILLDLLMPHISGTDLLETIKFQFPQIPIVVITGTNKIETAIECMKKGAYDYLVKPVEENKLMLCIKHLSEISELKEEVQSLKSRLLSYNLKNPAAFSNILTNSQSMLDIFKYLEAIAESPKHVLITGESGVGKELIAKAVHTLSKRTGAFVPVNVAGLDDAMFSDTLFGHKKNAYTGAADSRAGLIEQADNGTLFLDEIGDMELSSQLKLLRLLQEGEYYPLGSDNLKKCTARILFSTNADLLEKQNNGRFRKDLFYRLQTHHIEIPPLRERPSDIPLLIDYFLETSSVSMQKKPLRGTEELTILLSTYSFPGNVRELQSMIYDYRTIHSSNKISLSFFKDYIQKHQGNGKISVQNPKENGKRFSYFGAFPKLEEVEDFLIAEAMQKAGGKQTIAAYLLGVSPSTLSRRFKEKM